MSWQPRQYVNLFADEFRPARWPVPVCQLFRQVLGLAAGLLVLALVLAAIDVWVIVQLKHAEKRQQQAMEALLSQEQRLLPVALDTGLQDSVARLQQELQRERLRLDYLRNPPLRYADSFSPLMNDLSQHANTSLWLTDVLLLDGGDALVLAGRVPEPAVVSTYLQGLGELPTFSGRTFRQIRIERDKTQPWLNFELDTRPPEESAADKREMTSPAPVRSKP